MAIGGEGRATAGPDLPAETADLGVIVCSLETARRQHPELLRRHLGSLAPTDTAVGSDGPAPAAPGAGTLVHVPPGVQVRVPIEAASRGRSGTAGPHERTLLVAGAGSSVHYIDGCSAPIYTPARQRSSVVEVVVEAGASVVYTSIQNWSTNVSTTAVKVARVEAEGRMQWVDATIGSRSTSTNPTVLLAGPKAEGLVLSVASAGTGQRQETGARVVHAAPETVSTVETKLIVRDGGRCRNRGLLRIEPEATGTSASVRCDALVLDRASVADVELDRLIAGPSPEIDEQTTMTGLDGDRLFYLLSRGLSPEQAGALVVNGFIEPVTRALPMEYAVEWSRLVELQMERTVG